MTRHKLYLFILCEQIRHANRMKDPFLSTWHDGGVHIYQLHQMHKGVECQCLPKISVAGHFQQNYSTQSHGWQKRFHSIQFLPTILPPFVRGLGMSNEASRPNHHAMFPTGHLFSPQKTPFISFVILLMKQFCGAHTSHECLQMLLKTSQDLQQKH